LKPDGWSFYNPAAAGAVTAAQIARWDVIGGGPGSSGLAVGQRLRPNVAPYWEVMLTPENARILAQMDLVYLPVTHVTPFTEVQRKLLMRLVDSGVLLWVDWARGVPSGANGTLGGPNLANPFFLPLDFRTGARGAASQVPHPLLDGLFRINGGQLGVLR